MKLRSFFGGLLAMAAIAACEQPQEEVTPALDLNKTTAAVAADGGAVEFEVTANVDWTADADQDWVSVDPQTGNGDAKVKATVAANETADARTAKVTVKADKLTKTLTITQEGKKSEDPGEDPGEDPKPEPTVAWGMMGCFVDNLWGSDVPMTQEGEWIVAKGAQFTELTFKIRGNGSWDDATNIGVAPGAERGVVNGKVAVVTAEYSKANLGGDAADIKLNGEPGTYDVYFSFENLEVYVMEEGYKPGEKEPQNPDPVEITYTVVGTIADNAWSNNAAVGLMASEGDYLVAKNIPFVWNSTLYGGEYHRIEFKIVETGTWNGYAYPETNVDQYPNTEFTVSIGGENIAVDAPEGTYDVYFDKANLKVWVMAPGYKPGETPSEPVQPVEPVTEGVIWENDGTVGAATWSGSPYRFSIEGGDSLSECVAEIPAAVWAGMKIAPFSVNVQPAPEATWWQIRVLDGWWTNNDESGASDININTPGLVDNGNGTYTFVVDLTTNPELSTLIDTQHLLFAGDGFIINKIYFGEPEAPQQPEQPETPSNVVYADDFEWLAEIAAAAGAGDSVGEDNASAKAPNVWKMDNSADFFAAFNERGYQYLYSTVGMTEYAAGPAQEPNPEVGKEGSLYVQTNYLKFGQSSYNAAIVLPPLAAIEGTTDVVIEFDWCWQVTTKNKADIMTMSVDATAGTFEATATATSANIESAQSLVDGESHLAWQHATVVLNGATAETVLTIRPTYADPSVQNPERSQNRWFLDNIKVSTK